MDPTGEGHKIKIYRYPSSVRGHTPDNCDNYNPRTDCPLFLGHSSNVVQHKALSLCVYSAL